MLEELGLAPDELYLLLHTCMVSKRLGSKEVDIKGVLQSSNMPPYAFNRAKESLINKGYFIVPNSRRNSRLSIKTVYEVVKFSE